MQLATFKDSFGTSEPIRQTDSSADKAEPHRPQPKLLTAEEIRAVAGGPEISNDPE